MADSMSSDYDVFGSHYFSLILPGCCLEDWFGQKTGAFFRITQVLIMIASGALFLRKFSYGGRSDLVIARDYGLMVYYLS